MEKTIRAAVYCRVSKKEQADFGYSVDEQERLLIQHCKSHGYDFVGSYTDRGISGKNIQGREQLKLLLDDAKAQKFDIVLVWKINRISRALKDLLQIVELLERNSVSLKSITEAFDNSNPMGRMQFQMMGIIGEFERGCIAENVKMGMLAKAKAGSWNGGIVLGYDSKQVGDSNVKRPEKRLMVNEQEARIVREIFQLYASGLGYKAIVSKINTMGYKTKKGNDFSVNTVRQILMNPIYIGKIRFNRYPDWSSKRRRGVNEECILVDGLHEPIISQQLWEKVQSIMKMNTKAPKKYDSWFPLTGILKCPVCGAGMVITRAPSKGRKIEYYSCGAWKNKGVSVCNSNSIRVDKANEEVLKRLTTFVSNPKMIKEVVKVLNQSRSNQVKPSQKELQAIEKELIALNNKKQKIFGLFEEEMITRDEFVDRKEYLNNQTKDLEERKQQLQITLNEALGDEISYEAVQAILGKFSEVLSKCKDNAEKKILLQLIIEKITIDRTRSIDSIQLHLNDNLVRYLKASQEGISKADIPSIFVQRMKGYKEVDIVMCI